MFAFQRPETMRERLSAEPLRLPKVKGKPQPERPFACTGRKGCALGLVADGGRAGGAQPRSWPWPISAWGCARRAGYLGAG